MEAGIARPFGLWMATALVIGGMIGSGIFVLPAQLAPYGWTGAIVWLVAVAGALIVAWVMSGLTEARPQATGMVAICGEALGPLPGVLVGWAYWVGVWSANAVISLTAVRYLSVFIPTLGETPLRLALGAVVLVWLLTLLNLGGAKAAGRFQVLTTALKLLPLLAVVAILAGFVLSGGGQFRGHPHAPFVASQLTPALTLAFYALIGFEAAGVAAERVRDPARNVVRAMLVGVSLVGVLYIIVCSGIIFALPEAIAANATAPMAMFVEMFWGRAAGLAVAAFAAVAAIGCLNGWVLVQGELPLGMARAGLFPRWVGHTSRRDVPILAIVVASILASILVMSNAERGTAGLLDFMLRMTAAATVWLYIGACAAALIMRVRRVAAAIGLAFSLWVLWGSGLEAGGLSLVLMLTAIPLYFLRPRTDRSAEQSPDQAAIA